MCHLSNKAVTHGCWLKLLRYKDSQLFCILSFLCQIIVKLISFSFWTFVEFNFHHENVIDVCTIFLYKVKFIINGLIEKILNRGINNENTNQLQAVT